MGLGKRQCSVKTMTKKMPYWAELKSILSSWAPGQIWHAATPTSSAAIPAPQRWVRVSVTATPAHGAGVGGAEAHRWHLSHLGQPRQCRAESHSPEEHWKDACQRIDPQLAQRALDHGRVPRTRSALHSSAIPCSQRPAPPSAGCPACAKSHVNMRRAKPGLHALGQIDVRIVAVSLRRHPCLAGDRLDLLDDTRRIAHDRRAPPPP